MRGVGVGRPKAPAGAAPASATSATLATRRAAAIAAGLRRRLRERGITTPRRRRDWGAFTAHAMSSDRAKYLAHGFDDYITKPIVDETILLGSISTLLDRVAA